MNAARHVLHDTCRVGRRAPRRDGQPHVSPMSGRRTLQPVLVIRSPTCRKVHLRPCGPLGSRHLSWPGCERVALTASARTAIKPAVSGVSHRFFGLSWRGSHLPAIRLLLEVRLVTWCVPGRWGRPDGRDHGHWAPGLPQQVPLPAAWSCRCRAPRKPQKPAAAGVMCAGCGFGALAGRAPAFPDGQGSRLAEGFAPGFPLPN